MDQENKGSELKKNEKNKKKDDDVVVGTAVQIIGNNTENLKV
jgi:hypothetical protein